MRKHRPTRNATAALFGVRARSRALLCAAFHVCLQPVSREIPGAARQCASQILSSPALNSGEVKAPAVRGASVRAAVKGGGAGEKRLIWNVKRDEVSPTLYTRARAARASRVLPGVRCVCVAAPHQQPAGASAHMRCLPAGVRSRLTAQRLRRRDDVDGNTMI